MPAAPPVTMASLPVCNGTAVNLKKEKTKKKQQKNSQLALRTQYIAHNWQKKFHSSQEDSNENPQHMFMCWSKYSIFLNNPLIQSYQ